MLIKKLVLNNFRQFKGKQELSFSCDPEKNVTILLGDNTFGKTTISSSRYALSCRKERKENNTPFRFRQCAPVGK